MLLACLLVACQVGAPATRLGERTPAGQALRANCAAETARQLAPFREALAEGNHAYANLCQRVGPPDEQAGSGVTILIYRLEDGSEVWLGYGGMERLLYARHRTAEGQITELLPP